MQSRHAHLVWKRVVETAAIGVFASCGRRCNAAECSIFHGDIKHQNLLWKGDEEEIYYGLRPTILCLLTAETRNLGVKNCLKVSMLALFMGF